MIIKSNITLTTRHHHSTTTTNKHFFIHKRNNTRTHINKEIVNTTQNNNNNVLSVLCPILTIFNDDDIPKMPQWTDTLTSGLASMSRLPYGVTVVSNTTTDNINNSSTKIPFLQLYEFEACPFCRRVRETITDLDLNANIYPCPKNSTKHRDIVLNEGGKSQYPFLIDDNYDVKLYESDVIVKHLYNKYGHGNKKVPPNGFLQSTLFTGWMPTLLRLGRGMTKYKQSKFNGLPLILFNYEGNQFSRLVREVLCELEIPYKCISTGKGSKHREELKELQGSTQVPFLIDPNFNDKKIGDSKKIIKHLIECYTIT